MGSSYTLTDLVAGVLRGLSTVVSTVKAGVSVVWDGIKAAGQFIADTVIQVIIDTMVTLITAALRGLLMITDALLGSSFSYSESQGIFIVPIGGINLRIGLSSLQGGIAITFGKAVISIRDLFMNSDLTTETLGINAPAIFDEPIMKQKLASLAVLTIGTQIAGGLTKLRRYDQANMVFFGSCVASFLLDLLGGVSYVNTATTENRDLRLNFLRLLMVIELVQFVSLLFLTILEKKLSRTEITILTLLWTTITTPLELIDTFWSDGTTIGNFFAQWQFAGILIAKGLEITKVETIIFLEQVVTSGFMVKDVGGYGRYLRNPERIPSPDILDQASSVNFEKRRNYDGNTFSLGLLGYHLLMMVVYIFLYRQLKENWT